jgi:hypothetical protein
MPQASSPLATLPRNPARSRHESTKMRRAFLLFAFSQVSAGRPAIQTLGDRDCSAAYDRLRGSCSGRAVPRQGCLAGQSDRRRIGDDRRRARIVGNAKAGGERDVDQDGPEAAVCQAQPSPFAGTNALRCQIVSAMNDPARPSGSASVPPPRMLQMLLYRRDACQIRLGIGWQTTNQWRSYVSCIGVRFCLLPWQHRSPPMARHP